MKNSNEFYASAIYEMKREPVSAKMVLFMESYEEGSHGNCKAVLTAMQGDPRFTDWQFVWTVPNSVEFDLEQAAKADARITFAAKGSRGFVRALECAGIIVTGTCLPAYYVKREGQTVIGVFPPDYYMELKGISKFRVAWQTTLNKMDFLYVDNEQNLLRIRQWYPGEMPFQILRGEPLRFRLVPGTDATVVISLTKKVLGNDFSRLESKYKQCSSLCGAGEEILFYVEKEQYRTFLDENEPEILKHIVSSEEAFAQIAGNAGVIVTNRQLDALDAYEMGIPCIYISGLNGLPEYFPTVDETRFMQAGDWDEALVLLMGLQESITAEKRKPFPGNGMEEFLDRVLTADRNEEKKLFQDTELWIVPGNMPSGFWKAMQFYKNGQSLSILFRSEDKNRVFKMQHIFSDVRKIYCKLGPCAKNKEGVHTPEILTEEWERMVGLSRYHTIYAWDNRDPLWLELYDLPPAEELVLFDKNKAAEIFLEDMKKSYRDEPIPVAEINGNRYYELGEESGRNYYLRKKEDLSGLEVMFVKNETDAAEYKAQINEKTDAVYVLIDPERKMEGSPCLENRNIYWLPDDVFPMKLIARAEHIYGYDETVMFKESIRIVV